MKKNILYLLCLALTLFLKQTSFAQLSGVYAVPGTYTSIGSILTVLNTYGITGPVTVNISAGYTETVSAGGYSLTNVVGTSSINTITFQKSGAGANPLLVAPTGGTATPTSAKQDGVWRFIGSDYITIDGIDINDPNTTNPATMEFGYGFFKTNGDDGCQNNLIKNCVITLKRVNNAAAPSGNYLPGSRGIEFASTASNSHTTVVFVNTFPGTNSNNRFYANLIQNCNIGIAINGYTNTTNISKLDANNDIGGLNAVTGNTIINFGGGGTVAATGILTKAQYNINISNNVINSNNGSGTDHLGDLRLIQNDIGISSNVSILSNTLCLKGGTTCINALAIENNGGSTAANNTVNISNNLIANSTTSVAFLGFNFKGILNTAAPDYLVISGNTFTNNNISMNTGVFSYVSNTGSVGTSINITNNLCSGTISGTFSGTLNAIESTSGTYSTQVNISNNTFQQISGMGGSGQANYISAGGQNASLQLSNNSWNNLSVNISGIINLIKNSAAVKQSLSVNNNSVITGFTRTAASGSFACYYASNTSSASSSMSFMANNFSNITSTVSGTGNFYGFYLGEGNAVPYPNKQIYNNVISNINYNASGNFVGYALTGMGEGKISAASSMHNNTLTGVSFKGNITGVSLDNSVMQTYFTEIYNNQFTNLSNNSNANVYGASLNSFDSEFKFYKNKIANLNCTLGQVTGILCQGTSTANIFNNVIGHLSAPGASFADAVIGVSIYYPKYARLYNNTIYLTGTALGAECVYVDSYATVVDVTLKNNILINLCTASGTGSIAAVYKDAATIYNAASNNNIFYAGSSGPANTLLKVGNTAYNTLAAAQVPMNGAENNSGVENVAFASTTWSATNYLAVSNTPSTLVESGGIPLPEVSDDFNGTIRNYPFPDIGAIEGNYTGSGTDVSAPVIVSSGFSTDPCNTSTRTYTALISDASGVASGSVAPLLYYKIGTGSYNNAAGTLTSGSATLGVWTFILSYSAPLYSKISYFLAVQDVSTPLHLTTLPVSLYAGTGVTNITNAPAPLTYSIFPSLGGTYTVGTSGTFTTLTAAARAYNNACLTGPVTFVLSDALYSSNETFPVTFKKNPLASQNNSLLIVPATGVNAVITSTANSDTALVKFEDAMYITVDGLNNSSSGITALGTSTLKPTTDILIGSSNSPAGGCHHISIQNMKLSSTVSNSLSYGITLGASTQTYAFSELAGVNNNFISVKQNTFTSTRYGLWGSSTSNSTLTGISHHWDISNNQFGPASSSTANLGSGISINNARALSITNNTVSNISSPWGLTQIFGIGISGYDSIFVKNNSVLSVKGSSNNVSTGMSISANENCVLQNNMIVDVGFTNIGNLTEPTGLILSGSGIKMYNNTIALTQGSTVVNFSWYLTSKGVVINSGSRNIDMRNNLIYNNVNNQFASASFSRLMDVGDGNLSFSYLDHNNYFTSGIGSTYGFNGGPTSTTLEPEFVSMTDGHLNPGSQKNYYLQNLGIPVSGVTADIDNQVRNTSTPDVGADEFTSTATCTGAIAGTIDSPNTFTMCSAIPMTVSSSTVSAGIDIVNQWLVSTSAAGTYTNVSSGTGFNTPSYTVNGFPDGIYYFKLSTSCPAYSLSSTSNIATVTIVSPPTLSLSSTQNTICSGKGSSLVVSGANSYLWSNSSISPTLSLFLNASASYYLVYKNAPCPADTVFNINVFVQPTPSVSVISPTGNVCSGVQTTLSATGATNYSWSTGATGATITPSPTATTIYSVTGSYTNGCSNTATTVLSPISSPTVNVSSSSTLCSGQSATLTAGGAVSYTWSTGTVASSIVVSPSTSTVYTVIGRNSSSCTDTKSINVAVVPVFTINVSGPSSICNGQTASLTATGASNYTWSTGAFTPSVTVSPSVTSVYTLTGESGGCSLSTTRTLSISANPTVYITGSTVACLGQTGTLVANGATSYTWDSGSNASTQTISPGGTTTYTLTGSNGTCQAQTNLTVNTSTVPLITTAVSAASVCPSSPVSFTAFGANTYTWSNSANGNTITFNPSSPGVYTVNGSNSAGCVSSATVAIGLYSLPSITVTPPSATVCALSPTSFTASGASTYTWNGTVTGTSATLIPASSLFYQLTGASAQGCTNTVFFGVTTIPLPTLSINPPSASVCIGSAAAFTASGASSYTWNGSIVSPVVSFLPFSNTVYTVSGINAANCIATATVGVITNSLPVVSVSPSSTTVCAFTTATLTASGANSSYTWSNAMSGSSITLSAGNSTVITVVGTNTTGCSSNPVSATVNILPLPSLSITASAYTVCQGAQSTLTALGALSYTWNVGSLVSNTPTVIVTPTSSSVYQVIGTGANGCSNSFSNAVTASLVMIPSPSLNISGNTVICSGKSTTLTALAPTAINYSWTTSNTTQSVSVSPLVATNYSVTITDAFGCSNTASVSVLVNSLPTVSINGNSVVCNGTPVTLTASGAVSYIWNTSSTQPSITVSPSSASTYSVLGTDVNGCQAGATQTVNVSTSPSVTVVASNTVVCSGSTVVLQGSGANTYTWSGGVVNNIPFTPNGPATYSVSGTSTNGCQGNASIFIGINALPVISVTGNSLVCEGSTVTLNASGAQSFVWSNSQSSPSISVLTSPNLNYSVTGTDANGCQGTGSITLTPFPKPTLQVNSTTPFLCLGDSALLTVSGALKYLWDNSDTTQSIQIKPLVNTTFTVSGVDANGCSDTTSYEQVVGDCTGLAGISQGENGIRIYPNPNHGQFTVHLNGHSQNCLLEVFNSLGQLVYRVQLLELKNNYNLSDQAKGIYTLRITEKGTSLQHLKLIIE